jgi:hypothetical protein
VSLLAHVLVLALALNATLRERRAARTERSAALATATV